MDYWRANLTFFSLLILFVYQITAESHESNDVNLDKRQDLYGFNDQQKNTIVNLHNQYRSQQHASNMMRMSWDNNLAAFAQNTANRCTFAHSTNDQRTNLAGFQYVGENLYASTGSNDITSGSFVSSLYDEIRYYDYNSNSCQGAQQCGHYTQIVWANSYRVGCGARFCPNLQGVNWGSGYIAYCNYGPGGNYNGYKPYTPGAACTQCPSGTTSCVDGLCA